MADVFDTTLGDVSAVAGASTVGSGSVQRIQQETSPVGEIIGGIAPLIKTGVAVAEKSLDASVRKEVKAGISKVFDESGLFGADLDNTARMVKTLSEQARQRPGSVKGIYTKLRKIGKQFNEAHPGQQGVFGEVLKEMGLQQPESVLLKQAYDNEQRAVVFAQNARLTDLRFMETSGNSVVNDDGEVDEQATLDKLSDIRTAAGEASRLASQKSVNWATNGHKITNNALNLIKIEVESGIDRITKIWSGQGELKEDGSRETVADIALIQTQMINASDRFLAKQRAEWGPKLNTVDLKSHLDTIKDYLGNTVASITGARDWKDIDRTNVFLNTMKHVSAIAFRGVLLKEPEVAALLALSTKQSAPIISLLMKDNGGHLQNMSASAISYVASNLFSSDPVVEKNNPVSKSAVLDGYNKLSTEDKATTRKTTVQLLQKTGHLLNSNDAEKIKFARMNALVTHLKDKFTNDHQDSLIQIYSNPAYKLNMEQLINNRDIRDSAYVGSGAVDIADRVVARKTLEIQKTFEEGDKIVQNTDGTFSIKSLSYEKEKARVAKMDPRMRPLQVKEDPNLTHKENLDLLNKATTIGVEWRMAKREANTSGIEDDNPKARHNLTEREAYSRYGSLVTSGFNTIDKVMQSTGLVSPETEKTTNTKVVEFVTGPNGKLIRK